MARTAFLDHVFLTGVTTVSGDTLAPPRTDVCAHIISADHFVCLATEGPHVPQGQLPTPAMLPAGVFSLHPRGVGNQKQLPAV